MENPAWTPHLQPGCTPRRRPPLRRQGQASHCRGRNRPARRGSALGSTPISLLSCPSLLRSRGWGGWRKEVVQACRALRPCASRTSLKWDQSETPLTAPQRRCQEKQAQGEGRHGGRTKLAEHVCISGASTTGRGAAHSGSDTSVGIRPHSESRVSFQGPSLDGQGTEHG